MNKMIGGAVAVSVFAIVAFGAVANMPGSPPTPSARLAIDLDVMPVSGTPGQFLVTSTVTDLETNSVIAKPRLTIAANKPARIETGNEGKWMLQIGVSADGDSRKAVYDATFTLQGKVVSKQRVSVNLNG